MILPVELPDKTFIATLVLATRYPPLPVWLGVGAAFAVQCLIAVTAGSLLQSLVPDWVLLAATGGLFAVGAVLLTRQGRSSARDADDHGRDLVPAAPPTASSWRAAGASFMVLFAAEWGDLSQVLTAGLAARHDAPVSVFLGALAALLLISGLAVTAGKVLLRHMRLALLHYAGAAVCVTLAVATFVQLVGATQT